VEDGALRLVMEPAGIPMHLRQRSAANLALVLARPSLAGSRPSSDVCRPSRASILGAPTGSLAPFLSVPRRAHDVLGERARALPRREQEVHRTVVDVLGAVGVGVEQSFVPGGSSARIDAQHQD